MSRCHVRICYALLGLGLGAGLPWLFHVEPSLGGNRSNKTASGAAPTGPGDRFGQRMPAAAEKPAGNGAAAPLPVVTMAEVLAAEGGARMEKLALWLPTASSAECALMFGTVEVEQETRPSQNQYDLILRHWVGIDRDAAFRAARQTGSGEWACYHAWARLDPRAAWQEALSRDGYIQARVIGGIAESDPRYARELLDAAKDPADHARLSIGATIAGKLAEISPREAADYMLQHGGDPAAALAEWFSARPDEAQAWAQSQPTPQKQTEALLRLISAWRTDHPEKIAPLLAGLPEGTSKWTLQGRYVTGLAQSDPAAALEYAGQTASPLAKAALLQDTAAALADSKPETALTFLRTLDWSYSGDGWKNPQITTSQTPESAFGPSQAAAALYRLAENHYLPEALAIAEGIAPGPIRDQALGAVASGWPAKQMQELSGWLVNQTAPSVREAGARKLVDHLLGEPQPDLDAAARWAATLPVDAKPEDARLTTIMKYWLEKDPAAANTALGTMEIPAAIRQVLEKPPAP